MHLVHELPLCCNEELQHVSLRVMLTLSAMRTLLCTSTGHMVTNCWKRERGMLA